MYPAAPSGPGFIGTGFSFGCWVLELCAFAIPNNAQMQREAKMSETIRHADFFMKILHPLASFGILWHPLASFGILWNWKACILVGIPRKVKNFRTRLGKSQIKSEKQHKGTKGQRVKGDQKFTFFSSLTLCPFVLKKLSSLQLSSCVRR
jgi:hypothetical protein